MQLYHVVQGTLDIPRLDALQEAVRNSTYYTPADALNNAKDAFGILFKNLPYTEAQKVCGNLINLGVPCEVVSATDFPVIPPLKNLRRIAFSEEALILHDPLDRPIPVPWPQVFLIAGGWVNLPLDFNHTGFCDRGHPQGHFEKEDFSIPLEDLKILENMQNRPPRFMGILLLGHGQVGFELDTDHFAFDPISLQEGPFVYPKYQKVLSQLCAYAPEALKNRGAFWAYRHPEFTFRYPSKSAFLEEVGWLIWQKQKAKVQAQN